MRDVSCNFCGAKDVQTHTEECITKKGLAAVVFGFKDSGKREEFATGAVRDSMHEKGRYDLISPIMERRLAIVLQKGAEKYGPRNWEKGIPLSKIFDPLRRHLAQWLNGEEDEDHLGHAICNLMFLIHTEEKCKMGHLPWDLLDTGPLAQPGPEKE